MWFIFWKTEQKERSSSAKKSQVSRFNDFLQLGHHLRFVLIPLLIREYIHPGFHLHRLSSLSLKNVLAVCGRHRWRISLLRVSEGAGRPCRYAWLFIVRTDWIIQNTRKGGPYGSTRHGNITPIRPAIRRCDITFNFVSTARGEGGRNSMIG